MHPTAFASLKLASVSFAAALLLISCGPPIGDSSDTGSAGSTSTGTSSTGSSATTSSASTTGGTGSTSSGTTGGAGETTDTGTRLPPANSGGTSQSPNDCAGVTNFGNTCSPNVGWCNYAQAELTNNCAGCHGTYRYLANVKSDSGVESQIVNKTMPKGTSGLPTADISKIKTWIDCGYPK